VWQRGPRPGAADARTHGGGGGGQQAGSHTPRLRYHLAYVETRCQRCPGESPHPTDHLQVAAAELTPAEEPEVTTAEVHMCDGLVHPPVQKQWRHDRAMPN
jgi:hypothetical protein